MADPTVDITLSIVGPTIRATGVAKILATQAPGVMGYFHSVYGVGEDGKPRSDEEVLQAAVDGVIAGFLAQATSWSREQAMRAAAVAVEEIKPL